MARWVRASAAVPHARISHPPSPSARDSPPAHLCTPAAWALFLAPRHLPPKTPARRICSTVQAAGSWRPVCAWKSPRLTMLGLHAGCRPVAARLPTPAASSRATSVSLLTPPSYLVSNGRGPSPPPAGPLRRETAQSPPQAHCAITPIKGTLPPRLAW